MKGFVGLVKGIFSFSDSVHESNYQYWLHEDERLAQEFLESIQEYKHCVKQDDSSVVKHEIV